MARNLTTQYSLTAVVSHIEFFDRFTMSTHILARDQLFIGILHGHYCVPIVGFIEISLLYC